jgi:hypothetical protein
MLRLNSADSYGCMLLSLQAVLLLAEFWPSSRKSYDSSCALDPALFCLQT